jgi:Ser/Thr protein kinase RdoA (MazF antagonist)
MSRGPLHPPPGDVLDTLSARLHPEQPGPTRHPIWIVEIAGTLAVLHRYPPHRDPLDVAWEHAVLRQVAATGFPAPRPLPIRDGPSYMTTADGLFGLLEHLPGHSLGWDREPGMSEVGRFIARYHEAVAGITVPMRPSVISLRDAARAAADHLPAVDLPGDRLERLQGIARAACSDLPSDDPDGSIVIHGDLTNDNVLVDGIPPRIAGLIDFAMAHADTRLAELAGNLWRSGRSDRRSRSIEPARASELVRGYASAAALPLDEAERLPTYLIARGLQLILRWAGLPERGPGDLRVTAERVLAIAEQSRALRSALRAALA